LVESEGTDVDHRAALHEEGGCLGHTEYPEAFLAKDVLEMRQSCGLAGAGPTRKANLIDVDRRLTSPVLAVAAIVAGRVHEVRNRSNSKAVLRFHSV
jgi:hypothetical protein